MDDGNEQTLRFQVLKPSQREEIHQAVLTTLQEVGVVIHEQAVVELLKKAGSAVDGDKVYIPGSLVERALRTVPPGFTLYDRNGTKGLLFEGSNYHFGPGPSTTYIIDPYTGERRHPIKQDTRNAARVMDALDNIDFIMDFGTAQDVPAGFSDLHMLQAILENTTKPVVHWGFNARNCGTIVEMCMQVAGSLEELQKFPFICLFACSNTPLLHTKEAMQKLVFGAEINLPFVYVSAPIAGSTAPVTLAGTLVLTLAECLSGLVVHQLVREGAPFALGGVTAATDMQTMTMSYGCPEFNLMHAALTEMAHYYRLPLWGTAGCSDAKTVDQQAAAEAAVSIMASALSGTNMIHDVGYIEGGNTSSLAQLVMCNEIIGYVKRLLKGIRVDDTTLALDTIRQVGPLGEFITTEHTYRHFKEELWIPGLFDRHSYQKWVAGGSLTIGEKAMARARELMKNHIPEPLNPKVKKRIEQIVAEACSNGE